MKVNTCFYSLSGTIQASVHMRAEQRRIYVGVRVLPSHWNPRDQCVYSRVPGVVQINAYLDRISFLVSRLATRNPQLSVYAITTHIKPLLPTLRVLGSVYELLACYKTGDRIDPDAQALIDELEKNSELSPEMLDLL